MKEQGRVMVKPKNEKKTKVRKSETQGWEARRLIDGKMERVREKVTIYRLDSLTGQKQFGSANSKHHKSDSSNRNTEIVIYQS